MREGQEGQTSWFAPVELARSIEYQRQHRPLLPDSVLVLPSPSTATAEPIELLPHP